MVHSAASGSIPASDETATLPSDQVLGPWRCFHCGELCETVEAAEHHFGRMDGCEPICQVAAETYRALEREVQSYRSECDADTVLFYSLGAKHAAALREAEQTGYDRGLADAKAHPGDLGLMLIPALSVSPDGYGGEAGMHPEKLQQQEARDGRE